MKEVITSYYRGIAQQGLWYLGLSVLGLGLGFLAFMYWGQVGQGIFLVTLVFGSIQLFQGLRTKMMRNTKAYNKVKVYENSPAEFIDSEIVRFKNSEILHKQLSNFLTVAFLAGMLCLFLGAFGNGSPLILGVGAALAAEAAIQMIFGLLSNYRSSFYLLRLRKFKKNPTEEE